MVSEAGRDYRQTQSAVGCVKGRACEWTTRPQDHYPWYEEAFEAYQANPAREKYPLYGVSGHHRYWAHSLLRAFRGSTNFAVNLRCSFTRKPLRRAAFSRATRCVFNDHGYVVLKAVVNQGIRPDTLMLPRGPEGDDFIDGHTQSLSTIAHDEMTGNNFNDFVCEIEKYEGGAA